MVLKDEQMSVIVKNVWEYRMWRHFVEIRYGGANPNQVTWLSFFVIPVLQVMLSELCRKFD